MEGDSRERRTLGAAFLSYGLGGSVGLTSCEEAKLENAERTVAGVFPLLDGRCTLKRSIRDPIHSDTPGLNLSELPRGHAVVKFPLFATVKTINHDTHGVTDTPTVHSKLITRALLSAC